MSGSPPRGGSGNGGASAVAAQLDKLTIGKQIQLESEQLLINSGVPLSTNVQLAPKLVPCPPGPQATLVELDTNMWPLQQQRKTIYQYDVEFRGVLRPGDSKIVKFTKRTRENVIMLEQKKKARGVFEGLMTAYSNIFSGPVFCDLQGILYTIVELPLEQLAEDVVNPRSRVFSGIKMDHIPGAYELFEPPFDHFDVAIQRCRTFQLGDVSSLIRDDMAKTDRSLLQFLEIATSQSALMHPSEHVAFPGGVSYLMDPGEHGFDPADCLVGADVQNLLDPSDRAYLGIGVHKSVRFVSGPRDEGTCVLVVETKKSPFVMPGPLLEKAQKAIEPTKIDNASNDAAAIKKLNDQFRGKFMTTLQNDKYKPSGSKPLFKLKLFVPASSLTHTFDVEGRETKLADYYLKKYGYRLSHPNAPLAVVLERGRTNHYPIELLEVVDNQRIGVTEADPILIRNMIRACAIAPQKLKVQNQQNFDALALDNEDLKKLGVSAHGPVGVKGVIHAPPKLLFGATTGGNVEVTVENGKWRTSRTRYYKPSGIDKWAVVYIQGLQDRFTENDLKLFGQAFMKAAGQKGMRFGAPLYLKVSASSTDTFKNKLAELSAQRVDYILLVNTEAGKGHHDIIKWAETQYGFITQDTRVKTAQDVVKGKPMTLENIVNKANVKLGGLNYTLSSNDARADLILTDNLFIGFGAKHPGGGLGKADADESFGGGSGGNGSGNGGSDKMASRRSGPPTVVGFSANCNADPFEFVGDFMFQEARRDEKVSIVQAIVRRCLVQYHKNRKTMPRRVVLFRNGCAEGQFTNILKFEVPLIEHEIKTLAIDFDVPPATLTVIVPNKMHNVRFYPRPIPPGKAPEQNIKPGTTIDKSITSMNHAEFYLSAHTALQGTAKVPRYTNLERLVYWLCHGHQIVALTTSLPAPVYIANEYAKRGRNIYKSVTTYGDHAGGDAISVDRYKHMSYDELNAILSYWTGPGELRMSFRVNA
ncbi:WAGO-2 protein [Aphelenchoides avenae]|nr:WAGO-2 protein [Aphelenchus avenae]